MHRTQIILEDRHYEFLKERAGKEKKSISLLVREMIDRDTEAKEIYSLSSIAGIIDDSDFSSEDHDRWVYKK